MISPLSEFADTMGAAGIRYSEPTIHKLTFRDPVEAEKLRRRNGLAWLRGNEMLVGALPPRNGACHG